MKEENRIRALFLNQYLGEDVDISNTQYFKEEKRLTEVKLKGTASDNELVILQTNLTNVNRGQIILNIDLCSLLLRNIATLTKDEYYEIGQICGKHIFKPEHYYKLNDRDEVITQASLYCIFEEKGVMFSSAVHNYLIRKGILRPFYYLNDKGKFITLTTDEIIEKEWVKIKPKV